MKKTSVALLFLFAVKFSLCQFTQNKDTLNNRMKEVDWSRIEMLKQSKKTGKFLCQYAFKVTDMDVFVCKYRDLELDTIYKRTVSFEGTIGESYRIEDVLQSDLPSMIATLNYLNEKLATTLPVDRNEYTKVFRDSRFTISANFDPVTAFGKKQMGNNLLLAQWFFHHEKSGPTGPYKTIEGCRIAAKDFLNTTGEVKFQKSSTY